MNENGGTQTQPASAPPVPGDSPRPVMDVVARRPGDVPPGRSEIAPPPDVVAQITSGESVAEPPKPKTSVHDIVAAQQPHDAPDASKKHEDETKPPAAEPPRPTVNDVAPPAANAPKEPPKEDDPSKLIDEPKLSKKAAKAAQPKPIKQAKHGNGLAAIITTTVVVMLALSAVAVYAYLQNKK